MFLSIGMLKQKYFLTDIFILSAEKQPIKLSWRKIEWLPLSNAKALDTGEKSSNGPADEVKCAGGLHKKNCSCKPGYPACTETKCY